MAAIRQPRNITAITTGMPGPARIASVNTSPPPKPSDAARTEWRLTAVMPIVPATATASVNRIGPSGADVMTHRSEVSIAAITAAHSVTIRLRLYGASATNAGTRSVAKIESAATNRTVDWAAIPKTLDCAPSPPNAAKAISNVQAMTWIVSVNGHTAATCASLSTNRSVT